jgi:hypothetical protein
MGESQMRRREGGDTRGDAGEMNKLGERVRK